MTSIQASIDSSGAKVGRDEFVRNLRSMQDQARNAVAIFLSLDSSISGIGRTLSSQRSALDQSARAFGEQGSSLAASRSSADELSAALRELTQSQSRQGQSSQQSAAQQAALQSAFLESTENARLLGQALGTSGRNLRESVSALTQVSGALDRVRQDYGETEARVEQLERVVNGLRGSFRRQRDELIQTRGRLSNLTREFTEARAAQERYQQELRETAARTREVGTASTSAFRGLGPFAGLISGVTIARGGINSLRSFSQVTAEVGAVSGASATQLQALRSAALASGQDTEFGATQAGEALLFLSRAGFQSSESLQALPATLDIATAGALDLGRAADIASNALTQFGGRADELSRFGDAIVGAANRSNTSVEQLGTALSSSGTIAFALGLQIEDAAASIGILGNAGIQGSRAGTVLNNVLRGLSAETPKLQRTLESLGLQFSDVDVASVGLASALDALAESGEFSAQAAQEIAGRWGQAGLLALVNARKEVRALTEELNNNAGETERVADEVRTNLNASFQGAFNAASNLAIGLGDAGLTRALSGVLGGFQDGANASVGFLRQLDQSNPAAELATSAIVGLTTAVGAGGLVRGLQAARRATISLNTALAANPAVRVTSAIVGLGGVVLSLASESRTAATESRELADELERLQAISESLQQREARIQIAIEQRDFDRAASDLRSQISAIQDVAATFRLDFPEGSLIDVAKLQDAAPQIGQALENVNREALERLVDLVDSTEGVGEAFGRNLVEGIRRELGDSASRLNFTELQEFLEAATDLELAELGPQFGRNLADSQQEFRSSLAFFGQALEEVRDDLEAGRPVAIRLGRVDREVLVAELSEASDLIRERIADLQARAERELSAGIGGQGLTAALRDAFSFDPNQLVGGLGSTLAEAINRQVEQGTSSLGQRNALEAYVEQLQFEAAQAGRTAEEQERLAVAREIAAQGTRLQATELEAFTQAAVASISVRNALSASLESEANASALLASQQRELQNLQEQLALAGLTPAEREERRIQLEKEAVAREFLAEKARLEAQAKALVAAADGSLTQGQQEALAAIQAQIVSLDSQAASAGATAEQIAKLEIELEKVQGNGTSGIDDFTVSSRQAGGAVVDLIGRVEEADDVIRNFFLNLSKQAASSIFSGFFDGLFAFPGLGSSGGTGADSAAGGNGGPSDLSGTGGVGGDGGSGTALGATALSATADAIREAVADSLDEFSNSGVGASQAGLLGSESVKAIKQLTTAVTSLERIAVERGGVSLSLQSSAVSTGGGRSRPSGLQTRRRTQGA